jgi:3-(methylthio)propanoyl-CoA dehydrogenase
MTFRAPLKDLNFSLSAVGNIEKLYAQAPFGDFDADILGAVLEAAGDLANEVLAPINKNGDQQGARLENGQVIIAEGFKEAIAAFSEGGWAGLSAHSDHGGQGLPKVLELAALETFNAANMAFTLCPLLSQGAIEALAHHGTDRQKALYLPSLVSGDWTGTMNLTEPQAGSDLSVLTSQAIPQPDGTYLVSGQKIYITWGDHEARQNIIHLVLARLPDAPAGTRGISLFLCPKYLVNEDGTLGERNTLRALSLEHKLGIHGSPTCVMSFEGAKGELVGKPNQGLMAMFTMMNAARVAVGVQGVGIAERSYQHALWYALDRKQGRSAMTGENNAPIYDHPDVRLMLGLSKAKIEAARGICFLTGMAADLGRLGDKDYHKRREDFLTPIAKSWGTDIGVEVASMGVQVHGGMGFIEETGAAQFYRDARIAPIYEGTNGIQAADLVGRKLGDDAKSALELSQEIKTYLETTQFTPEFDDTITALKSAILAFDQAGQWLISQKASMPSNVAASASAYLKLSAEMLGGYVLVRLAHLATERLKAGDTDTKWLKTKIALMQIYGAYVLPHADAHLLSIKSGLGGLSALYGETLMA